VRVAALGLWSLLSFAGTLALLLYEPDAAFAIIPAILVLTIVTPFVRLDATPWTVTPPLAALALWSGSAPGFYVHGLFGASLCAAVYGVVMLVRFSALSRRRPVAAPARRAWLTSLVLGLVVAFVTGGAMPLELRFRLSEDAMTRTAREVIAGERDPATIERIGLWNVSRAERLPGGMRFDVEGAGILSPEGFLFPVDGLPPPEARYYRSGWYLWTSQVDP
jgi:hypothetical protein